MTTREKIKEYFYYGDGELYAYSDSTYDANGNIVDYEEAYVGSSIEGTEYIYDEKGRLAEEIYTDLGIEEYKTYIYDNNGNVVKETEYYEGDFS